MGVYKVVQDFMLGRLCNDGESREFRVVYPAESFRDIPRGRRGGINQLFAKLQIAFDGGSFAIGMHDLF
jgi:hypothetical protein